MVSGYSKLWALAFCERQVRLFEGHGWRRTGLTRLDGIVLYNSYFRAKWYESADEEGRNVCIRGLLNVKGNICKLMGME